MQISLRKADLAARVRLIEGKVQAVADALNDEAECGVVLKLIEKAHAATSALMAEILGDQIKAHVLPRRAPPKKVQTPDERSEEAEALIRLIRVYMK